MRGIKEKLNRKEGFTLAELLIVVAIISVLVAIAIPVFTNQLEKSRETTDAANIRSAYAEIATAALTDPGNDCRAVVQKQQKDEGWDNTAIINIAGVELNLINDTEPTVVEYSVSTGQITIDGHEVTSSFIVE